MLLRCDCQFQLMSKPVRQAPIDAIARRGIYPSDGLFVLLVIDVLVSQGLAENFQQVRFVLVRQDWLAWAVLCSRGTSKDSNYKGK